VTPLDSSSSFSSEGLVIYKDIPILVQCSIGIPPQWGESKNHQHSRQEKQTPSTIKDHLTSIHVVDSKPNWILCFISSGSHPNELKVKIVSIPDRKKTGRFQAQGSSDQHSCCGFQT